MRDITLQGRLIKINSNRFFVDLFDEESLNGSCSGIIECVARKNLKKSELIVGDAVEVKREGDTFIIFASSQRKNALIRPLVANVDAVIIVVAPLPQADYLLVDKMILNARKQDLQVYLCVNKTDIDFENLYAATVSEYKGCVDEIVAVSAAKSDVNELKKIIGGKTCCLAGQSAVGKSSIINLLTGAGQQTGELSRKTQRGKNTTTSAEILKVAKDTYIVDTPGFSLLDVWDVSQDELPHYYDDFLEFAEECRFKGCCHVAEPDCHVKKAVSEGLISPSRYERYKIILEEVRKNKSYGKRSLQK